MNKTSILEEKLTKIVSGLADQKKIELIEYAEYLKAKEKLMDKEIQKFDNWAEDIAKKRGFNKLTEKDVMDVILECRKERYDKMRD